ncbi:MAG: grasp-with-spasm system SPASM domain peptide maturase [Flavobacteriales bacterium]|nr:grasp-with-spasm system SPASM domain peptide maturase [Flavobacteriales bacterium]
MKNKFFLLFEDCRIVEGYTNAIIYDLNRSANSNHIPKSLVPFIEKCKSIPVLDVINSYENVEEQQIAQEYLDFLLEREFGFLADSHVKDQMGKLNLDYETASTVQNAIICCNDHTFKNINSIISQLNELLCEDIEFRCVIKSEENFNALCNLLNDSVFQTIIFRMDYEEFLTEKLIENCSLQNPRISHTFVYGAPVFKETEQFTFLTDKADYYNDCGKINKDKFVINQPFYLESQSCNTCLHKKISIDFEGNIKNCPSMHHDHGCIKDKSLVAAIDEPKFKTAWFIKKDEIEICSDCEFRHMCLDCRAFIDNPENPYSRPSTCGYNPYIGKWLGEAGYKSFEECGVISNEQSLSIDHDKIASLNEELWAE